MYDGQTTTAHAARQLQQLSGYRLRLMKRTELIGREIRPAPVI